MLLATPSGMSYWTGSPASSAASPAPAPKTTQMSGSDEKITMRDPLALLASASPATADLTWLTTPWPIPTTPSLPCLFPPSSSPPVFHDDANNVSMLATLLQAGMQLPSRWNTATYQSHPLQFEDNDTVVKLPQGE